jgi:hypothetical protein
MLDRGNSNPFGLIGERIRQVQARAEPAAGARQDHDAALVVGIDRFECGVQVFDQAVVECVQLVGPVERDEGDVWTWPGQFEMRHGT